MIALPWLRCRRTFLFIPIGLLSVGLSVGVLAAPPAAPAVNQDVARETLTPANTSVYTLEVVADRPEGLYKSGETATFKIRLLGDGKPVVGETVSYLLQGEKFFRSSGTLSSAVEPATIPVKLDGPGFVLCEVSFRPKGDGKTEVRGAAGVGADPLALRAATPEPADFDAFWMAQKAELAKVPLKELERVEVPIADAAKSALVVQYDVKVDCAGGAPVSGYLTMPRNAKPKSLPIILSYHGAGVSSSRPQVDRAGKGFLCMDVNAHGIVNGKPQEFYDTLRAGGLREYYMWGNKSRDTAYFRGMFLRVLRSLEYMKSLPEWDGKNVIVSGGSQGGAQALVAAGLDPQVTYCSAAAPWLCNFNGVTEGSVPPSWPGFIKMNGQQVATPDEAKALAYFDPALMAKRIKAECGVSVGYQDRACPPASVYVAYNNIPGKKQIYDCPLDTHKGPSIYQKCNEALSKYLEQLKAATAAN